jgi:ABC-type Fe3+-hydroxamate transport system substrate-binding protein
MAARRVVSLCPSITETIVEIGGRERLVAATRYCTRPRGTLRGLTRVGGTKDPDVAAILGLRPDLVFANEEENRHEDVQALRDAGVEVSVTFPRKVSDVPGDVRRWGRDLGGDCGARGEDLASRIAKELESLEAVAPPKPFRYAYWIWKDPWMTVSDDTYVADLLRLAGGVNVYGSQAVRYPTSSPPESLARGAEVHFFPDEPFAFRPARHSEEMARLFPGTERLFVAGDDLCWHGYRTLAGLETVRRLRVGSFSAAGAAGSAP